MAACGEPMAECTLMGCSDSLSVDITTASGTCPAGEYALDVTVGSEQDDCSVEVVANSSTGACTSHFFRVDVVEGRLTLEMRDAPDSVSITVERDGVVVGVETITPTYVEFYPNGEDCDSSPCRQADATMIIS